jgi:aminopeptidase N/puromycin-sensitive aminopeptidase
MVGRVQASFIPYAAALLCLQLGISAAGHPQRLPATVVPTHYSLAFTPDLKAATFAGRETIDVVIKQPTSVITLNAIELNLESADAQWGNSHPQTGSISYDPGKQQATLTFPTMIPAGPATVRIRFTGILNNELRGFYLSKTAKRNYAVTQFEATDARRAFPCFDEPALKATFSIALTIDGGDTAISNTPIATDTPGPDASRHTVTFAPTPRMSTYLVAFLVGDFKCIAGEQDDVQVRVCSTPDKIALAPYALNVAKFSLHYYDSYFGIHYPLKKLDLIAIPDFEAGAMENFGAITFRDVTLLLDPKTDSNQDQLRVTVDITHEIAHQWFGDLVTMKWWDNVWLNEGFATWMENKCAAAMHPDWGISQDVAGDVQRTLDVDAQPTTRAIRAEASTPEEIDQLFDSIAYDKASNVLLMVENYEGEETFRRGVHNYLAAHEYGNATAEDFWNAQAAVSNKPVDKIMESLVAQAGEPILTFGEPAGGTVAVSQKRFYLSPGIVADPSEKWTVPVCFKGASGRASCDLVTPATVSLKIPAAVPFFADAGGKGFYRSAYAPRQYAALVRNAETRLTPDERISLLGDEWAQVRANKASVGDFLDLVAALKADPNSEVLSKAVGEVLTIGDQVASDEQESGALAVWIRRTLGPEYAKLGPPAPNESRNTVELRARLFNLLAYRGKDPNILSQAREITDRYLSDPASVDPTLAQTALGVAAVNGDVVLFDHLQRVYETTGNPDIKIAALHALADFTNPELLQRALEYAVSDKVRNQDSVLQFTIAMQIAKNRDATWSFIKSHWDQVRAEFTPEMGYYLVASTGSLCTADARDDVKAFFAAHPVRSADVAVKHSLERIDGCVELRRLQEPNLKSWLAVHAGE